MMAQSRVFRAVASVRAAFVLLRLRFRAQVGALDPISIMAGITVITILSATAAAYWPVLRTNAKAGACIANLEAVTDAAELYASSVAEHEYPASQAVQSSTFVDAAGVDYLQTVPKDPADLTGVGKYTFTNTSASGIESYIVSCPGVHSASALQGLPGWKTTSSTIYRSGGQTYTQ